MSHFYFLHWNGSDFFSWFEWIMLETGKKATQAWKSFLHCAHISCERKEIDLLVVLVAHIIISYAFCNDPIHECAVYLENVQMSAPWVISNEILHYASHIIHTLIHIAVSIDLFSILLVLNVLCFCVLFDKFNTCRSAWNCFYVWMGSILWLPIQGIMLLLIAYAEALSLGHFLLGLYNKYLLSYLEMCSR